MNEYSLIFRLPQTAIRALGIPNLHEIKFLQRSIHKSFQNHTSSLKTIYDINEALLSVNKCDLAQHVVEHGKLHKYMDRDLILDKNIITDLTSESSELSRIPITLIEYANSDHPFSSRDLIRHPITCAKSSGRVLKQVSHLNIVKYLCWIGESSLNNSDIINFRWTNELLDYTLCARRIFESRYQYADLDIGFRNYLAARNPVLVLPSHSKIDFKLASDISRYINDLEKLLQVQDELISDGIFIKPHRSLVQDKSLIENFPRRVGQYKVHLLTRPVEVNTPAEWYLFANKPIMVIANLGSSIISIPRNRLRVLPSELDSPAKKALRVHLKRNPLINLGRALTD
jgi:hypothetical protein